MAVTPITTLIVPPSLPAPTPAPGAAPDGFTRVLQHYLGGAGQQQVQTQQALLDVALGRSDNVHGVVLEAAKADLAFRLLLEVRNRLTDAYQEIMKMQI
jgi:flagellar hook-basal body complex protein FliE